MNNNEELNGLVQSNQQIINRMEALINMNGPNTPNLFNEWCENAVFTKKELNSRYKLTLEHAQRVLENAQREDNDEGCIANRLQSINASYKLGETRYQQP
jgi:hypothetical protein